MPNAIKHISLDSIARAMVLLSIIIWSLPRANHPLFPFGISGLEAGVIPIAVGLFLTIAQKGRLSFPRSLVFGYILLIPVLLLWSSLAAFLIHNDSEVLMAGVLQSLRRVGPSLLLLLLWQNSYDVPGMVRICKYLVVSTLLGAVFFILLANGWLSPFTMRSDLAGNPITLIADVMHLPAVSRILTNLRFAGNTGSPTTYAVICSIDLFVLLGLYRRKLISKGYNAIAGSLLVLLIFATAAKAVLALAIPLYLFFLCRGRLVLIVLLIALMLGAWVYLSPIIKVADNLTTAGEYSLTGRYGRYHEAFDIISENSKVMLFGEGWRSREVGWHSEIVEIFMGFGLFVGSFVFAMEYIYIPWIILRSRKLAARIISSYEVLAMYAILLFASLFQDIFHDGNVLFVFVLVLFIMTKSLYSTSSQDNSALPSA